MRCIDLLFLMRQRVSCFRDIKKLKKCLIYINCCANIGALLVCDRDVYKA